MTGVTFALYSEGSGGAVLWLETQNGGFFIQGISEQSAKALPIRWPETRAPGPAVPLDPTYGVSLVIRVAQFANNVRVPPQLPIGRVRYTASVQVWEMYSEAIQMDFPSTAVAP